MGRRPGHRKGTRWRRDSGATAPLTSQLDSLTHEIRVLGGLLRKIAIIVKAQQPSIAINPYLREDFERDVVRSFLEKSQRSTTDLAVKLDSYPKKVLRAIKRINRRTSKREGAEPFVFDAATRSWKLELELVDAKELR